MSLYVEWANKIKAAADETWLTDSQRAVYNDLRERWQSAPFVCLCGPSGSGKTFIARLLANKDGYAYSHDLSTVQPGQPHALLDNTEYSRLLRTTAAMLGIKRVIILAQRPPRDPMPRAELLPTDRDVAQFQGTLTRNSILTSFHARVEGTNLGDILRNEAIARGNNHATARP